MILPIVAFGSKILRKKSIEVSKDEHNLSELIKNMWETMYEAGGVGLAAPQVNKSYRLFIIDTTPFLDDKSLNMENAAKKVFINPKIINEKGEKWIFNEGCLSIPEIREDISRRPDIKIEYFDESFNKQTEIFTGINARVIQHEYDHLNGVLFIDKVSPLRKRMIKGKLVDISKGKITAQYKMRY